MNMAFTLICMTRMKLSPDNCSMVRGANDRSVVQQSVQVSEFPPIMAASSSY